MKNILVILSVFLIVSCGTAVRANAEAGVLSKPTFKDVRYSEKYERSVMDIWLTDSQDPAPVLVYFHGGGFKGGDKKRVYDKEIYNEVPDLGVVLVSANYPFIHQLGYDKPYGAKENKHAPLEYYETVIKAAHEAIIYLRKNAAKYGIDPNKIMISGSSAGATIAEVIGLSLDDNIIGLLPTGHPALSTPQIVSLIDKGDPPMVIWSKSGLKDEVHHPSGSKLLQEGCVNRGLDCELYGIPKRNGLPALPKGQTPVDVLFSKVLK